MLVLALAALIPLGGRVVEDHTGNPLASVEIQVSRPGVYQLAAHLETTPEGRFVAEGLPDGEYRLKLSKRNYLDAELTVTLPLSAPLALRMVRTGVILGQVTDGGGRAVPAVYVHAMQRAPGGGPLRRFGPLVAPNEKGQFRMHGVPAPVTRRPPVGQGSHPGPERSGAGDGDHDELSGLVTEPRR